MNTDASEVPPAGPPAARRHEPSRRQAQADTTRSQLLLAAERLYATHGISEVSNRQVAEAAGSANNSAVGYYLGTKSDLLEAMLSAHNDPIAQDMKRMVERTAGSPHLHDYVQCLVRPYTDHLARLGTPSWFARVIAQVVTDPTLVRTRLFETTLGPTMRQAFSAMWPQIAAAPEGTVEMRQHVLRNMVIHTCAEQERLAHHSGTPADWELVSEVLIHSVTAILTHVPECAADPSDSAPSEHSGDPDPTV
ncbi:TetR family transcriptional regulator [Brachybacterium sacelli]|uniref:AcrR family transcriptional regulator n=1 Tax=Brachybacterium sacelli TaxID=173364 RepID=A0ABS4WY08_9MICO|nr:AcrR family transcriptional regulator [Brachybacterium sacelli]